MKEATGELSVTVITVVAIAAVATLFYTLVWPAIQKSIVDNTCATYGDGYYAIPRTTGKNDGGTNDINAGNAAKKRYCCTPPSGQSGNGKCID